STPRRAAVAPNVRVTPSTLTSRTIPTCPIVAVFATRNVRKRPLGYERAFDVTRKLERFVIAPNVLDDSRWHFAQIARCAMRAASERCQRCGFYCARGAQGPSPDARTYASPLFRSSPRPLKLGVRQLSPQ